MFSILSRNPNKTTLLRTIYSGYSNIFVRYVPSMPYVAKNIRNEMREEMI